MDIEQGGPAARRVYDTLELRREIFGLLDQKTLVGLFRLEKGVVASVAEMVYEEVYMDQMRRFKRTNPRHAVYLDSVRILDRTPPPSHPDEAASYLALTREQFQYMLDARPVPFNLNEVLRKLSKLRERFQQVQTILYRPSADDTYDIRFRGGRTFVDLESRVLFDVEDCPPENLISAFPGTPRRDGMAFSHRITIRLRHRSSVAHLYENRSRPPTAGLLEMSGRWTAWLFSKSLDRRVTHIQLPTWIEPTFGVVMTWLESRQGEGYEPITDVDIPWPVEVNAESLRRIGALRLPELNSLNLRIPRGTPVPQEVLQGLIDALDAAFPALQQFDMGYIPEDADPMVGLPNLLQFRCSLSNFRPEVACSLVAMVVCDLGSAACVYESDEVDARWLLDGNLNERVQILKPPTQ